MLVKERLEPRDKYEFEGPIDTVIAKLYELKARYPGKNIEIVYEGSYYDSDYEYYVIYRREETDEEKALRLKQEERDKSLQLKYNREQYEKLKKMFEGQNG